MSMVSVSVTATNIEADRCRNGTGFYVNAWEGDDVGPEMQRVTILLTDEQAAELRRALDRPKPSHG